jgi:hypothetical protein
MPARAHAHTCASVFDRLWSLETVREPSTYACMHSHTNTRTGVFNRLWSLETIRGATDEPAHPLPHWQEPHWYLSAHTQTHTRKFARARAHTQEQAQPDTLFVLEYSLNHTHHRHSKIRFCQYPSRPRAGLPSPTCVFLCVWVYVSVCLCLSLSLSLSLSLCESVLTLKGISQFFYSRYSLICFLCACIGRLP